MFCLVFALIYEYFSHNVYSLFMLCSFLLPLLAGALPFRIMAAVRFRYMPGELMSQVYGAGIVTLTVGCIFRGVLDIYGTTNALSGVYWLVGAVLVAASIIWYVYRRVICKGQMQDQNE